MRRYLNTYHERTRPLVRPEPQRDPALPPRGVLIYDDDGRRVQCHECGEFRKALGSHVREHGLTADAYKALYGLNRGASLASPATQQRLRAAAIARDQGQRFAGQLGPSPRPIGTTERIQGRMSKQQRR